MLTLSQATHLLDKQHLEGDKSFIHQLLIRAKQLTSWTNSIWKVISPLYTSLWSEFWASSQPYSQLKLWTPTSHSNLGSSLLVCSFWLCLLFLGPRSNLQDLKTNKASPMWPSWTWFYQISSVSESEEQYFWLNRPRLEFCSQAEIPYPPEPVFLNGLKQS